jgi:hypothetical protein
LINHRSPLEHIFYVFLSHFDKTRSISNFFQPATAHQTTGFIGAASQFFTVFTKAGPSGSAVLPVFSGHRCKRVKA